MDIEIHAVHMELENKDKEYLQKKLNKLDTMRDHIANMSFIFSKEKEHNYKLEVTLNFRWGVVAHVEETDFTISECIDKLTDRLIQKVHKEKEKIQSKN